MGNNKQTAVITGAGSGIGKATALLLAKYPQNLVLLDTNKQALTELQKQLYTVDKNQGLDIVTHVLDVTQETAVQKTFDHIRHQYARIDILINAVGGSSAIGNAGVQLEDMDLQQWQTLLNLNLTSIFLCCREVVPLMKQQRYGRIINFSSIASHGRRDKVSTAYAASKAGVEGFTRKLARETAPFGITCNAIAPGITLTERVEEKFWHIRTDAEKNEVLQTIPLGRLSTAEEQAHMVVFLASQTSSYLTGQVIEVSGGM